MASWCVSQLTPDPRPKTRCVLFWRQGNVCKTTSQHFIYHIATYYIVHKHFVYHIEGSINPWHPQPKHGALCCFGTGTFAKPHRNMVHNVLFTTSTLQKNSTLQKKNHTKSSYINLKHFVRALTRFSNHIETWYILCIMFRCGRSNVLHTHFIYYFET